VTSQGHPYAIFRRALDRRDLSAAWAAATEIPKVSLEDAGALAPIQTPFTVIAHMHTYCMSSYDASVSGGTNRSRGLTLLRSPT
jgi:hypothetical protein